MGREPSLTDGAGCFVLNDRNRDEHPALPGHNLTMMASKRLP